MAIIKYVIFKRRLIMQHNPDFYNKFLPFSVPHDVVGVVRDVLFSVSTSLEDDNLGNSATLSYDRRLNRTVTVDHVRKISIPKIL